MNNQYYYEDPNAGGSLFSTLIGVAILAGIIYLLVKKVLPWINQKLGKDFKWWQVPMAILAVLFGAYALIMASEHKSNKAVGENLKNLGQLSDKELLRVIDSHPDPNQRRSAEIVMEERIKRRKGMLRK